MALGLAILVSALLLTTLLVAALGVAIGAVALLRWTWRIGEH
jgi:hypothetical protein